MFHSDFKIDFLGIGAPRSGTSWLSACLDEHPEICFSRTKELDYFNSGHFYWVKNWKPRHREPGAPWYENNFKHFRPGQKKGEFSVVYLYDSQAAELIRQTFPAVKLLLLLRNPAEAVYSHYLYHRFDLDLPSMDEIAVPGHPFLQYGYYSGYLRKYYKEFPRENIMIILYDEIISHPEKVLKKVYTFLNVGDGFNAFSARKVVNAVGTKQAIEAKTYFKLRNYTRRKLGGAIKKIPGFKSLVVGFDGRMEKALMKTGRHKTGQTKLPATAGRRLKNIYKNEINELEEMIGQDLSSWK